ncbi:methyl-accepting chemotaxis protein [Deltaproteobacteria bacterium TL4]
MIDDAIRLLKNITNFINLNLCERTFLINLLGCFFFIPLILLSYFVTPPMFPFILPIGGMLLVLAILNLHEVHQGKKTSLAIYPQIILVVSIIGVGTSALGSVSTGIVALSIFLSICYYLVAGVKYAIILGVLNFSVLTSVMFLDFIYDFLPYYWARDLSEIGRSGSEVRDILGVTKPAKVIVEMIFVSTQLFILFILKGFDNQLSRKTLDLEKAHSMLQESKDLSDSLLKSSQEKQYELQNAINELLKSLSEVGEGHLEIEIKDFQDPLLSQLANGVRSMVEEIRIVRKEDEDLRFKEQEKSSELINSIQELLVVVNQVGQGNLNIETPDFGNQALGQLSNGLKKMIENQNRSRKEEERHQRALARTNALVENAPNSLMMLDAKGIVRYMNPATKKLFASLQRYLSIDADYIIDRSYEMLIHDKQLRITLLDPRQLPYATKMQIGDEWLHLEATAVYDGHQTFLGPTLAWEIITTEKKRKERDEYIQRQVKVISQQLAAASNDLLHMSEQLAAGSYKTSQETQLVVVEAKEIQGNITHIANAVEEMANTLTFNESLVAQSTHMSGQAVQSSQRASEIITALGKSSMSIGIIVQLINRIAQQTNILALNATIQATRAGDVGKGFGVVAREVKALAQQTSEATKKISSQVKAIQQDSQLAVEAIQNVNDIIEKMNDISGKIYTAIEEQTHTTHDITSRMGEASKSTKAITSHIDEVAHTAEKTQQGSEKGREAVVVVGNIVGNLNALVTEIT